MGVMIQEEFKPHPRAKMMPDLPDKKYQALKAGIEDHGLQHPIKVLKGTSYLLDGRHRLRACEELGIPPKVEEVDIPEDQVPIYTAAQAAQRDGLTTTQKVLLAIGLLPELKGHAEHRQHLGVKVREGEKGKAAQLAATLVGVSARYVEAGINLRKKHSVLFDRVTRGELTLSAAQREADGKETKSKSKQIEEDRFSIPNRLRDRLVAATDAVRGEVLGDGVEALLDFIEGDASDSWHRWSQERAGMINSEN